MSKIFVVGSYVQGLTIRVPRQPVLGENLVGESFDMGPGGKGTNQAIAMSRLGTDVELLACIGDDIFGEMARNLYEREGIATDNIHTIPDMYSGVGFVNVVPSGENWITVDMGANLHMTPQHIKDCHDAIASSDIIVSQFEVAEDVVMEAMRMGKEHGVTTILNPAPARLTDHEMFEYVDVLTPNATEVRILLGLEPDDMTPTGDLANRLLDYGMQTVVVTLGKEGALIISDDDVTHVPAIQIDAVDVTGAGDSFNAMLAVGMSRGKSIESAVGDAVYAGAYTATHSGVIDGLPTTDQLEMFRQKYNRE